MGNPEKNIYKTVSTSKFSGFGQLEREMMEGAEFTIPAPMPVESEQGSEQSIIETTGIINETVNNGTENTNAY